MTDEEFGLEIKAARERKGWMQKELARRLCRKPTLVCGWEKGHTPPQPADVRLMIGQFDDWAFNLAVARFYTGGFVGIHFEGVDGGRVGAAICVKAEMEDVVRAIDAMMNVLLIPANEIDRSAALELCIESVDVIAAANEKIRRLAEAHGIGASAIVAEQQRRAFGRGYASSPVGRYGDSAA